MTEAVVEPEEYGDSPQLVCLQGGKIDVPPPDLTNLTGRLDRFMSYHYPVDLDGQTLRLGQIGGTVGDRLHYAPGFLQFILEASKELPTSHHREESLAALHRHLCHTALAGLNIYRNAIGKVDKAYRDSLIQKVRKDFAERPSVQVALALTKEMDAKDLDATHVALDAFAALGLLLDEHKGAQRSGIREFQDEG